MTAHTVCNCHTKLIQTWVYWLTFGVFEPSQLIFELYFSNRTEESRIQKGLVSQTESLSSRRGFYFCNILEICDVVSKYFSGDKVTK